MVGCVPEKEFEVSIRQGGQGRVTTNNAPQIVAGLGVNWSRSTYNTLNDFLTCNWEVIGIN